MSIRKLKGDYYIQCDRAGCGASLNTHIGASKPQAWGVAKRKGWWARHVGPVWQHFCSKACYDAPAG